MAQSKGMTKRGPLFSDSGVAQGRAGFQFDPKSERSRGSHAPVPREQLRKFAQRLYDSRRARARHLHISLLGEPVWDMLLALYCLPEDGARLPVSGLCEAACVPPTTALRWVQVMEQKKLIRRMPDPGDGRRTYLLLTEEGERVMTDYLSDFFRELAPR